MGQVYSQASRGLGSSNNKAHFYNGLIIADPLYLLGPILYTDKIIDTKFDKISFGKKHFFRPLFGHERLRKIEWGD